MLSRLAVAVSLVLGASHARADSKVDWSQYIEAPGARGPAIKHADLAQAKPAPAAKKTTAKPAAKAKPKAAARKKR